MRNTSRLTAPSLLLIIAASAIGIACEDSGSSSGSFPPAPTFDAGDTDTGGPLQPPPPPPPPGTGVTLTVLDGTKPVAGVRVFFQDGAGAITAEHKTDANGKVTAATAPPQLTALVGRQVASPVPIPGGIVQGNLVTYTALAEGDNLVIDASAYGGGEPGSPTPAGKWSVTVPGQAPGVPTFYGVMATRNCEDGTSDVPPPTTIEVDLFPSCLGASNAVLASAHDDNNLLAFAWKKGLLPPNAGQTTAVTLDPPWASPSTFNLKATNIPADGEAGGVFFLVADGGSFAMRADSTGSVDSVAGMTTPVPGAGFATSIQATAYAELDRGSPEFATVAVLKREPPAASMTIDLAQALPRLTNIKTTVPSPRRPEATWSSAAPLTGADGGYVRLDWTVRINPDEAVSYTWTFVVPPNATSVKAPALPADLPFVSDGGFDVQGIAFADSSVLPGYKELKSLPVSAFARGPGFDVGRPLPSDGTVRLTLAREGVD